MPSDPLSAYQELMAVVRSRFDTIDDAKRNIESQFLKAETCAFHGRKIVEGIAFACLIALENSLKHVPRDAQGQWKADAIFNSLEKKSLGTAYPSPSIIRKPTDEEASNDKVSAVIEGQPDRRLTKDELAAAYVRFHRWNHEVNPYVVENRSDFITRNEKDLWKDIEMIWKFIEKHVISIGDKGFFCVLKDNNDGLTKVMPIQR